MPTGTELQRRVWETLKADRRRETGESPAGPTLHGDFEWGDVHLVFDGDLAAVATGVSVHHFDDGHLTSLNCRCFPALLLRSSHFPFSHFMFGFLNRLVEVILVTNVKSFPAGMRCSRSF
ncbi:hypothetical protein EYF80_058938 [Liparis tanakae]|uniref:Uncharacterized protein n=1 Tax=Liparis tanakae TaxID=230148 RepID=A0A4Z2EQ36_9TELE|nr:hypothetical protein EYF80_058938 [Liparis tanakae]